MSFILDTDICSAYLHEDRRVFGPFIQHSGGLYVSTITVAELWSWGSRSNAPQRRRQSINDLFALIHPIPVDDAIAEQCGHVRASLLDQGIVVELPDLLIATSALMLDFTLVTHNTKHFTRIPNLRLEDWLV